MALVNCGDHKETLKKLKYKRGQHPVSYMAEYNIHTKLCTLYIGHGTWSLWRDFVKVCHDNDPLDPRTTLIHSVILKTLPYFHFFLYEHYEYILDMYVMSYFCLKKC